MGGSGCPRGFIRCPHVFGDALCFAEEEAKTSKDQGGKCGLKKPWKQQVGNEIERRFFLHNPKLCIRKCRWSGRISDLNQIHSRALTKSDGLGGLPFFSRKNLKKPSEERSFSVKTLVGIRPGNHEAAIQKLQQAAKRKVATPQVQARCGVKTVTKKLQVSKNSKGLQV